MNWFHRWFSVRPPESDGKGIAAASPTAAFLTPQTLLTFAGASTAVTTVWGVLKQIADFADDDVWALVLSLGVGAFIVIYNYSKATTKPTHSELAVQVFIAILNSFILAAAALGITDTANVPKD